MATRPLNSLADRFVTALVGRSVARRTKPLVFNIGLDFGTAFTKCLVRDVSNNVAFPVFAKVAGVTTFLIPSEVRVRNGQLSVPFDTDYAGDAVSYLKMAVAAVADPREKHA